MKGWGTHFSGVVQGGPPTPNGTPLTIPLLATNEIPFIEGPDAPDRVTIHTREYAVVDRKGLVRRGLKLAILLVPVVVLVIIGVQIRHAYEVRHVSIVFVDDISTSHPNGLLNLPAKDRERELENIAAFDDFNAAFAEDADCRGLTLVRDTSTHDRAFSFPYAYWFVNLYPVLQTNDALDANGESENYSQLNWELQMKVGGEPLHSDISQSSKTAKEAAHNICLIASQKAGSVW